MKVTNLKRIMVEEFPEEDRETVKKLAFALNPFLEQLVSAFNKNIDFDNLKQDFIYFETTVDANGVPVSNSEILIKSFRPRGIQCVFAQNLRDNNFPTGAPFVTFTIENNVIKVLHVTGLPANKPFRLGLILYP